MFKIRFKLGFKLGFSLPKFSSKSTAFINNQTDW